VVGTGFGTRVHVPALRAAGFDVVALVGRDPDRTRRRAERLDVPLALTDLDAALSRPDVDAVTVATPPSAHAPVVLAAVAAGKHVLCEKPFALDTREAEAMLSAADAAGVTHLLGHEFRLAPERAVIGLAIADGQLGRVGLVTLVQLVPLVADPGARTPPWWFDPDAGGGWLGASGSHVVDQIRAWLGDFTEVSARLPVVSERHAVAEDSFVVRFRLRGGADGVLAQTAAAWGPMGGITRLAGSRASAWIDENEAWIADIDGVRRLEPPPELALPAGPPESDDPRHRFTHLELAPFTRLAEALRAGVEGRATPTVVPLATFADGVAAMRVLDAIRASAADEGRTVSV
jgi:predicted dehydrogenase